MASLITVRLAALGEATTAGTTHMPSLDDRLDAPTITPRLAEGSSVSVRHCEAGSVEQVVGYTGAALAALYGQIRPRHRLLLPRRAPHATSAASNGPSIGL